MSAQLIAAIVVLPFAGAFIYAAIHEYLRYKSDGRANYGLVFDDETGTSYVSSIAEDDTGYDPEDFDPGNYNDPETRSDREEEKG
ncbi:hypothetical protein [Pseudooceanicola sp.]|uniref:hypothetical protein n=1 Tax=Pseudooceanicola sp. TaxID=1914328 RepID=UPI0035C6C7F5